MKRWIGAMLLVAFILGVGILFVLYNSRAVAQEGQQQQSTYVGLDRCKTCNQEQFKDYEKRRFKKAWSVLEMQGKIKDPECLKCHTTGFGQPGGFVSEETTPHLKYKQCESCHGPGSIHAGNPANKEMREGMKTYIRDKDVCVRCHICMKTHKEAAF